MNTTLPANLDSDRGTAPAAVNFRAASPDPVTRLNLPQAAPTEVKDNLPTLI